jgi:hypothetical protein
VWQEIVVTRQLGTLAHLAALWARFHEVLVTTAIILGKVLALVTDTETL